MPLVSPLLSSLRHVRHGFGDCKAPVPGAFSSEWTKLKPVWRQVHGAESVEVIAPGQACGDADALFTFLPKQPVAVITADCVPVLLARKDGKSVAAIHAGWRGTRARILRALWSKLSARNENPANWVAAIGPAIGPCCYEVSEALALDFSKEFPERIAVPRYRHLDLPAINEAELLSIGFAEVDLLRACTRCEKSADGDFVYHSYRREGGGTRQWSIIEAG